MVTTRSTTRKSKLPGYSDKRPTTQSSKKRKASPDSNEAPNSKKTSTKRTKPATNANSNTDSKILINRSPVLQLWSASVVHFTNPELDWSTCLSAGSAVSSICAVAKGKSIGVIEDHRDSKSKNRNKTEDDFERLRVMQFKLKTKDGLVYMGSDPKPKPGTEETLKRRFGERYADVRGCFDTALKSWTGDEEELTKAAFGMYERFRPTVKVGKKGWGKRGELNLDTVKDVVMKS